MSTRIRTPRLQRLSILQCSRDFSARLCGQEVLDRHDRQEKGTVPSSSMSALQTRARLVQSPFLGAGLRADSVSAVYMDEPLRSSALAMSGRSVVGPRSSGTYLAPPPVLTSALDHHEDRKTTKKSSAMSPTSPPVSRPR